MVTIPLLIITRHYETKKYLPISEVDCIPQRNKGYDKTASFDRAHSPEVDTMYLLSRDCDFLCLVQGKTMFEVARFSI